MIQTSGTNILNTSPIQLIVSKLATFCKNEQYSLAIWRQPNSTEVEAIVSFDFLDLEKPEIESLSEGFIFAPFSKTKSARFLPGDIYLNLTTSELKSVNQEKSDALIEFLANERFDEVNKTQTEDIAPLAHVSEDFEEMVAKAVQRIKEGHFQKVVPSRSVTANVPSTLSIGDIFKNVSDAYPNAFTSLVSTPDTDTWVGATPELLLSTQNGKVFKTVALAGTQAFDPQLSLGQAAWRQKEIEEQAFVSRYIINCFKKIRLREFDEIGPKTVRAGSLIHLKTEFIVDMEETNFPNLGSTMLGLLHPTSAVCGMPLKESMEFIKENEAYDREFFSGYLGPVNIQNTSQLYVNLRCMKLIGNKATFYAGAGVTSDSNPEKELTETELKMNTLRHIVT